MAGEGRTLWDHMRERLKGSVESRYKNPLGKKIGATFSIDDPDFSDCNFLLKAIREVKRTVGGEDFYFSDYDLCSNDGENIQQVRLRFCPLVDPNADAGLTHTVLLLKLLEEFEYSEDFHKGLLLGQIKKDGKWVDDPSFEGGFCIDEESDGEIDSTYWRVNDAKGAHEATVQTIEDTDGDGLVEIEEVKESKILYWDFWREIKDEVGEPLTEFIFTDMGKDDGYTKVWQGPEIVPDRVVVF